MTLQLDIIPNPNQLHINISGIFDTKEAIEKFSLILAECKDKSQNKILVDFTQMDGDIAATEKIIYTWGIIDQIKIFSKYNNQELHVAFVGKAPQISSYEPGADFAKQDGISFILTTEIDKAVTWLNSR